MNRKIVIVPTFCDAHIIKFQIDNIINVINPDVLIYNECMWPSGPENFNNMSQEFVKKYCKPNTNMGFDSDELNEIIVEKNKIYNNVEIIHNRNIPIKSKDANVSYVEAVSYFGNSSIKNFEKGDVIFPYEADVFLHIKDKKRLEEEIENLKEDESIKTRWVDFIGTQYYTEKQNHPNSNKIRSRKLCIKFGSYDFYKLVNMNCLGQNYSMCKFVDIMTYHYNWFRPVGKYKNFRYEQLKRRAGYWETCETAIQKAIQLKNSTKEDIRFRNSDKNNDSSWISYVELEHPVEIQDHPCFLK